MGVAGRIGEALEAELALPSVEDGTVIVVRLFFAAVLGALVGWDRERKQRPAGLKTHVLVSIGSALFVLAPLMAGIDDEAVTRVMQGIVSGIGFLGAGAIIKLERDERIEGLTTAAGIWMTAAIGMAAGMGMELVAVLTTAIGLGVIGLVPRLLGERKPSGD